MKKVAIISRHAISNYGSFFQAVALERKVRELGYDACTVDYVNEEEKSWHLCRVEIKNSKWNRNIISKLIFYIVNIPNRMRQYKVFRKFQRENLNLTNEYNTLSELKSACPIADLYCTGSDQVWNETINDKLDEAYFLTFLDDTKTRISYAASFGKDFVKEEKQKIVKTALSKYKQISVRESSGKKILEEMGLLGTQVLDPTLLLSGDEWRNIKGNAKAPNKKYVLIYQIHKNEKLVDYARQYAKQHGCELINISVSYTQKKKGAIFKCLPDYRDVLAMFDGAYCIITDSFHATAFSINFNKRFVMILPKLSVSRIKSILKLFDLEDRVISDVNDFDTPNKIIDYETVNRKLEEQRESSINWLKQAIEQSI